MTATPPPLLEVRELRQRYRLPRPSLFQPASHLQALAGVSFTLRAGQSLGVVGESGSGKSTLARLVMALEAPEGGQVLLHGQDLQRLKPKALRALRPQFQMVFQDPYGSLDPRQTVARIVAEPLSALQGAARVDAPQQRVLDTLVSVGLREADLHKFPHEFSGGQRQRIAIARALVTRPQLIVADEPVSALDVSVQAQVLNLLQELQERFQISYLLISHDLAVVDHVCDEVLVMVQGRVVEQGPPLQLFQCAAHPYTQALLAAVPRMEAVMPRRRIAIRDNSVSTAAAALACAYSPRCPHASAQCHRDAPVLRRVAEQQFVACHHPQTAG